MLQWEEELGVQLRSEAVWWHGPMATANFDLIFQKYY